MPITYWERSKKLPVCCWSYFYAGDKTVVAVVPNIFREQEPRHNNEKQERKKIETKKCNQKSFYEDHSFFILPRNLLILSSLFSLFPFYVHCTSTKKKYSLNDAKTIFMETEEWNYLQYIYQQKCTIECDEMWKSCPEWTNLAHYDECYWDCMASKPCESFCDFFLH